MAAGTFSEKLIPFVVAGITCSISATLICARDYRNTGGLLRTVRSDRASTALIVQILSSILGLMQIYVATSVFKFATRIRVIEHPTTLGTLQIFTALCTPKSDFDLPIRGFILATMVVVLSHGPGALWAGALTPVLTTITSLGASIQTPTFTRSTENYWNSQFQRCGDDDVAVCNILTNCSAINNQLGFISTCPVPDFQGSLLNSGSSATTLSGAPRNHSKFDNPGWSYQGRSYGVASSEGIISLDGLPEDRYPVSYNYTQIGYDVAVACTTNTSADFSIAFVDTPNSLTTWQVQGYLPNSVPGNPEFYPTITWASTPNATAGGPSVLGWSTVVNPEANDRNMIAIAAGGSYAVAPANLNQTQCTVEFNPQAFAISVNVTSQTIVVTELSNTTEVIDIEPSGSLTNNAMWSLNLLSRMTPSLYESTLGNTLKKNVNTLLARPNLAMTDESATLLAISDSFTAMLDDVLVAFGSSQLGIANSSTSTPVTVILPAVQIGQNNYIFATAGVNFCLLLLLIVEAIRTRFWHALPLFDYNNIKTVIVAASADNGGIARQVALTHEMSGKAWRGDSGDKKVDEVRVRLIGANPMDDASPVLQFVEEGEVVDNTRGIELEERLLGERQFLEHNRI